MRILLAATAALALAPSVMVADTPSPVPPGPICGEHPPQASSTPATVILTGYGTGGFAIRTRSARAQAFFDNGMQLGHAFAHQAAISAFKEAERLDPDCAMCAWGEAWAAGPTINYPIDAKAQAGLAKIADHAAALAKDGPAKERQLTAALQLRYRGQPDSGDIPFAKAMDAIARSSPADNELAVLAADAWMIPAAHDDSRANLDKALALLEPALKRNPEDTGAIHFYIHATEMDGVTARALPYAERLERLAPSASHLVHMPSHTFFWTGRYGDAVSSNVDAVAVDQSNARRLGLGGDPFSLVYHGHNVSFGIGAAMIDGDGAAALGLARPTLNEMSKGKNGPPQTQYAAARSYVAEGRYGPQAEVAALAQPGSDLPLAKAMWRYARGEAAARRGDAAAVNAEAAGVQLTSDDLKRIGDGAATASVVVRLARLTLEGRAAMLEHHPDVAARAFAQAAALQDSKLKDSGDPPAWWYPSRRSLAAADLAASRPADAAREARAVLARWPDEPLTLLVLARAEAALGQKVEAEQHMAAVRRGWKGDLDAIGPAGL
jgi:tetratricopeptide (TPR) repeat protein